MTYVGSTAASSVVNVPDRITNGLLSQRNRGESTELAEGGALWTYSSSNKTTDIASAAGGFFTDGARLGMRNGDFLISAHNSTNSSTGTVLMLSVISGVSSTSDAASVSTEAFISSTATEAGGG